MTKRSALPRLLFTNTATIYKDNDLSKTKTKQRYLQSTISSAQQKNLELKKEKNSNQITSSTIAKPIKKIKGNS